MYAEKYINNFSTLQKVGEDYSVDEALVFKPITSVVFNEYENYYHLMESASGRDKAIMEQTVQVLQEISFKDIWETIKKWIKKEKGLEFLNNIRKRIISHFSKKKMNQTKENIRKAEQEAKKGEEVVIGLALPGGSFNNDKLADIAFKNQERH